MKMMIMTDVLTNSSGHVILMVMAHRIILMMMMTTMAFLIQRMSIPMMQHFQTTFPRQHPCIQLQLFGVSQIIVISQRELILFKWKQTEQMLLTPLIGLAVQMVMEQAEHLLSIQSLMGIQTMMEVLISQTLIMIMMKLQTVPIMMMITMVYWICGTLMMTTMGFLTFAGMLITTSTA